MTLEQLEKFSGNKSGSASFAQKPFAINKWRVATDGHILIAENGFSDIKLPELEACSNREKMLQWLAIEIPAKLYSSEHLKGYLGDEDSEFSEPMMFCGHRIDKEKLRKVFTVCDEPYRFLVNQTNGLCFHFSFGKIRAMIMGMIQPQSNDPRYEPKPVSR